MRKVAVLFGILLVFSLLVSCVPAQEVDEGEDASSEIIDSESEEENVELFISDAPADIADFESLEVTLEKVRFFQAGEKYGEASLEGVTVELTELVDENAVSVLSLSLTPGEYQKVELYVESIVGIVDGEEVTVELPSGKLQLTQNFEVVEGEALEYVFDINVVQAGNSGKYNLQPVVSESGVVGKDVAEINKIKHEDSDDEIESEEEEEVEESEDETEDETEDDAEETEAEEEEEVEETESEDTNEAEESTETELEDSSNTEE